MYFKKYLVVDILFCIFFADADRYLSDFSSFFLMKKLLVCVFASLLWVSGSTFALSCVSPMPTFEDMYQDATMAFKGTLTQISAVPNESEHQYCEDMNNPEQVVPGTYSFTFTVTDALKGTF